MLERFSSFDLGSDGICRGNHATSANFLSHFGNGFHGCHSKCLALLFAQLIEAGDLYVMTESERVTIVEKI
jgi:hypothetical protein